MNVHINSLVSFDHLLQLLHVVGTNSPKVDVFTSWSKVVELDPFEAILVTLQPTTNLISDIFLGLSWRVFIYKKYRSKEVVSRYKSPSQSKGLKV
jgi:hypothetical protein